MRLPKIQLPNIPEEEKTPVVLQLIEIIEQISVVNQQQAEEIQLLKDEIARLKGQKPKPNIKPSKLEKVPEDKEKKDSSGKRPGSDKRSKTAEIIIHKTISIAPENIPPGSTFREHQPYTVVGIKIEPYNVRYLLERWQTPDGNYIVGKLPPEVQGHFECRTEKLYFVSILSMPCHTAPSSGTIIGMGSGYFFRTTQPNLD